MADLERAITIATEAHNGQLDKGGEPYILHPLRVMARLTAEQDRIVAILHDVAEDCPAWPLERLRAEFAPIIGAALDAITKRKGEDYDAYLGRVKANPIAAMVKLADLEDNSDMTRLGRTPTDADWARRAKYDKAATFLMAPLPPHRS